MIEYTQKQKEGFSYFLRPPPPKKFKGVKVSALQAADGAEIIRFETLDIPGAHPIKFSSTGTVSQVTPLFGLPLLTWQATDPSPTTVPSGEPLPTAYLNLSTNEGAKRSLSGTASRTGTIPEKWRQSKATTLVVHSEGKPLSAVVVEAACNFCKEVVSPLLQAAATKSDGNAALKDAGLAKKWELYLRKAQKEATEGDAVQAVVDTSKLKVTGEEADGGASA